MDFEKIFCGMTERIATNKIFRRAWNNNNCVTRSSLFKIFPGRISAKTMIDLATSGRTLRLKFSNATKEIVTDATRIKANKLVSK